MSTSTRAARPALLATLALVWLLVPLTPVLLWAGADRWSFPAALPQDWGLSGVQQAADDGTGAALLRSLALGLAVAALATPLGMLVGRVLGWRLTRRPVALVLMLLLPLVLPAFAVAMGFDVVLIRVGAPEPVAVVLLLTATALPYTAFACAAGFARTPRLLEEQARALGATSAQARRLVVLPAVRASVLTAALLAFLVGWSDYVVTVLVGGGRLITGPVLLGASASGAGNDTVVAAIALATVVPPVVLVLLAGRRRSP